MKLNYSLVLTVIAVINVLLIIVFFLSMVTPQPNVCEKQLQQCRMENLGLIKENSYLEENCK